MCDDRCHMLVSARALTWSAVVFECPHFTASCRPAAGIASAGIRFSERDIEELFHSLDTHDDGHSLPTLSYREIAAALQRQRESSPSPPPSPTMRASPKSDEEVCRPLPRTLPHT